MTGNKEIDKLQCFVNKCLLCILTISWPDAIRNELWKTNNKVEISEEISNRNQTWIDHTS